MIELRIKRDPTGFENVKKGCQSGESSLPLSSMGVSPPPWGNDMEDLPDVNNYLHFINTHSIKIYL